MGAIVNSVQNHGKNGNTVFAQIPYSLSRIRQGCHVEPGPRKARKQKLG